MSTKNNECQTNHMTYNVTLCFGWEGLPSCPFPISAICPAQAIFYLSSVTIPLFLLQQPSWHGQVLVYSLQSFPFSYHSMSHTKQTITGTFSCQNILNTKFDVLKQSSTEISLYVNSSHYEIGFTLKIFRHVPCL